MIWVLKILALIYLGFGAYLYFAQRTFMYFPVPENSWARAEVETLAHDGEVLKLWVTNPGQPGAVIYFGGNAEDVAANLDEFRQHLPGRSAYLVNYRGYGGSSGSPSQTGLFSDALAIYDMIKDRHDSIAVIGRSLGSGVATYLASERDVDRLVLATPHDSAVAIAQNMYPVYPIALMLKDKYESVSYAPAVSAPTLMLLAEDDTLIPRTHSERLAAHFPEGRVELRVIERAGHNGIAGYQDYWASIRQFLTETRVPEPRPAPGVER